MVEIELKSKWIPILTDCWTLCIDDKLWNVYKSGHWDCCQQKEEEFMIILRTSISVSAPFICIFYNF